MNRKLPRLPGRNGGVEDWKLWADEMLDYTTHLEADAQNLRAVITDVLGVPDGRIDDLEMLAMDLQRRRAEAEVVRSDQRLLAENAELRREAAENAADKKESLKCIRTLSESISRVRRGRIDYDRVRAEVPECEGLTDGQIDWIATTIRSADILSYKQKASCNKLLRDLTDWSSTAMTARGREVLAAIEACQPEPEEQCSEPVAVMMRVQCHAVVRALDSTTTLHTYTDADGPCCEINWGDQVSPIGAAHETLALREAVRLVAMRDGRYDAATDRVRLTGLEPQQ